jgi:Arc/MetJ-type ribon-helix-helix transcriptional regulator
MTSIRANGHLHEGRPSAMSTRSKAPEKVTIKIPRPLYEKIGHVIEGAGYNSVTDFVVYILRDIVSTHRFADHEAYTEEDLKAVKERLRSLGYLPEE